MANTCWPELNVRGFCELPWTTLEAAGGDLGTNDYFGINHLGWIYGLDGQAPLPLKYWRLHFERDRALMEQRIRPESRAAELKRLTNTAFEAYATGAKTAITSAIDLRHAPWYSQAFAPLVESWITRTASIHFFFSVPNQGWNPSIKDTDILEIPFQWENGELIRRTPRTGPPRELMAILKPFIRYEKKAAEAILSRDPAAIGAALESHPWVRNGEDAKGLARAIVTQNSACEVSTK